MPAADGKVKVKEEDNGNSRAEATTYVVWVQPDGSNRPQNLGALKVDDDREGNLETVTPHKKFLLFVTAETGETPEYPTGEHLLHARVD